MPVEARAMLIYTAMLACLAFFYGVYKLGRATPDWLEARKAKRAEHKRKKHFRTIARAHLKVKSGFIWSQAWHTYSLMVIFQENAYGERRVLCEDGDVNDYPPVREWLDGGDTKTLERLLSAA